MKSKNTIKITSLQKSATLESKPILILIHGFLCSSSIWQSLIKKLQTNYNLFTIDLPGHNGDTQTVTSIEQLAFEITTELKQKNLTNVHLVGHSLGGYIAGEITKQNEITPLSITLINSSLLADSKSKKQDRDLAIRAIKITPNIFTQNVIEKLFLPKNRLKLAYEIEKIQDNAKQISPETIISYLKAMKNRNRTIDFVKSIPIHFMSSINDSTIPFNTISDQVKTSVAQLTTLEKSGHMSFLEESNLVTKSINSFFVSFTSLPLK